MSNETHEEKIAGLERDLRGVQEMLAFVLLTTGPVVVTKERLKEGLPPDMYISIDDDHEKDAFVFHAEEKN